MDKFIILWVILLLATTLSSCRNGGDDSSNVISLLPDDLATQAADTIAATPSRPVISTEAQAREMMENPEDSALYNAGILPRMLSEVPEYALKLLNNEYPRFIIADKYTLRVLLYDRYGRVEKEYKMTCARNYGTKHARRDNRTPEGFFTVEGIYDSTEWLYRDDDGNVSQKKGQFGPRFIRLKIPVTSQIGIHGTCSPWSLGGRYSHGCIRISNENILELAELVEPGMPVIVSPGRRDMAVNQEEGYDIPAVSTGKTRPTPLELPKPDTIASQPAPTLPDSINISTEPDTIQAERPSTQVEERPDTIDSSAIF